MDEPGKFRVVKLASIVCFAFLLLGLQSEAQTFTLTDGNSSAAINTASQLGMSNWSVDGTNRISRQWFWYRVGNTPEASIDTISAPTNVTPNARELFTTYNNGQFSVEVDYLLTGGLAGSGKSDIEESIRINNLTGQPLDFHFFQYSDFDLSAGNDVIQLGKNLLGLYNEAFQTNGNQVSSDTVITPGANHGEAAFFPVTLNKLNDGIATTLSDNAGPVGPGNVTWAFQWDLSIAASNSVLISVDKSISVIPEPSAVVLIGVGLLGLLVVRRK